MPNTKKQHIIENLQKELKESHAREDMLNKQCNDLAEKILELRTALKECSDQLNNTQRIAWDEQKIREYEKGIATGLEKAIELFTKNRSL